MEIINNNQEEFLEEKKYLLAKKQVDKMKGFYWHLVSYLVVNVMISGVIIFGLISEENLSFVQAISNFGVYATWIFWGIGLFFHWFGVFGTGVFLGKDWEKKKIEEYMKRNNF